MSKLKMYWHDDQGHIQEITVNNAGLDCLGLVISALVNSGIQYTIRTLPNLSHRQQGSSMDTGTKSNE